MRQALDEYAADPGSGRHSIRLFMAANLALWLEQAGRLKPVKPEFEAAGAFR
jgi:hypothetical protein